ncbi:MAG: helix-hairpin-helix domain-containing protein [Bacteroidales bacterium]
MMKQLLKAWNNFSKTERRGIITLSAIIFILLIVPSLLPYLSNNSQIADIALLREYAQQLDSTPKPQYEHLQQSHPRYKQKHPSFQTFHFEPNSITLDSLLLLGFSQKQAKSIIKYRQRGARFSKPSDFLKINVISPAQRERLLPYIIIHDTFTRNFAHKDTVRRTPRATIELNSADTATLRQLYGIGAYLAKKIVTYREQLGGYCDIRQLLEIQHIKEEVLERIAHRLLLDTTLIKKIRFEEENFNLMRRHPYIGTYAARGIVQYAKHKGDVPTLNELQQANILNSQQVQQLRPYIDQD